MDQMKVFWSIFSMLALCCSHLYVWQCLSSRLIRKYHDNPSYQSNDPVVCASAKYHAPASHIATSKVERTSK